MTLPEYIQLFETKLNGATKKSEIRTFKKFVAVLTDLNQRDMEKDQIEAIESELDRLELQNDPQARKKGYSRKFGKFIAFLQKNYSWVTQGYYTSFGMIIGMTMGMSIGIAIGAVIDPSTGIALGISIGTGLGLAIGIAIGSVMDKQAIAQGRVLNVQYESY